MIEITNSLDKTQWREFVYDHPQGNIFQTPEMVEVYKRTKNYEPISIALRLLRIATDRDRDHEECV